MKYRSKNSVVTTAAIIAASFLPTTLIAADGPEIRIGFDIGGEELLGFTFTDGTSESLDAGEGFFIEGGYHFDTPVLDQENLSTEVSVGYKNGNVSASNASISFSKLSVGLTQYFHNGPLRLGAGIHGHLKNTVKIKVNSSETIDADTSFGPVLVADYQFQSSWRLGVRYTIMEYTAEGVTVEANSAGIYVSSTY